MQRHGYSFEPFLRDDHDPPARLVHAIYSGSRPWELVFLGRLGCYGLPVMAISTVVGRGMLGVGVAGFIGRWLLSAYFMAHRPQKPEIALGLIFPFNQHGGIVYLTHFESILLSALFWGSILLIGVGASFVINSRASKTAGTQSQH